MEKFYETTIRKYKCCICGYLLTMPPIMTSKEIDKILYKCGRCKQINLNKGCWNRNHLFEQVAQFLYFPCTYTLCKKRIPFSSVEEHERDCLYKTIKCPLSKYCESFEEIPVDQIGEHFRDRHEENIKTADSMARGWEAYSKCNYIFLLQIENEYFFVYIVQGIRIAVLATRSTKYIKFNVKLKICSKDNFIVSFYDLPVRLYDHYIMYIDAYLNQNEREDVEFDYFTSNLKNELFGNADSFCGKLRYYIKLVADEIVTEDPEPREEEQATEEEGERKENRIINLGVHSSVEDLLHSKLYEVIKKYKCCVCGHLLSVPPIMVSNIDQNNEVYKCGRCKKIVLEAYSWNRNHLFEEVALFLPFPCSFYPCMKGIPWSRANKHEGHCRYKTIKCPLSNDCKCFEDISVDQIGTHITVAHNRSIETNDTMTNGWALNSQDSYLFLMQMENQYFFVYILNGSRIAVLATKLSKYVKFNVKLKLSLEDNFEISFNDLPIVLYDVKFHCTPCIFNMCNETHYTYLKDGKGEIDVRTFTGDLSNGVTRNLFSNNRILRYYITLIADENILPKNLRQVKTANEKEEIKILPQMNLEVVRRALTCPYCMTYMVPPIFTCRIGHTVCNECRPRLQKCPLCKASFKKSRNYILEEMANDLELPCQFSNNGCTYVGSVTKIYSHELKCSLKDMVEKTHKQL